MSQKLSLLPTAICAVTYAYWRREDIRHALSLLMEKCSTQPEIASDVARDQFTNTELCPPKPVDGHTHATAAALRSCATRFARFYAASSGGELYSISQSRSDQRKGIRGERQWYWAKDVNASNAKDEARASDIAYMCDVDYYKDMPKFMSWNPRPILLYTVVPEAAAGTGVDDTSFCFEKDGQLRTYVAGAGSYCHRLWDYGHDSVFVLKKFFGIPIGATVFSIERRQVGYSRQLILLAPIRKFNMLGAFLGMFLLSTPALTRFDPIVHAGGMHFTRFRVHKSEGTYFSTAICGTHLCANVTATVDQALAIVARNGSTPITLPTTASWVGNSVGDDGLLNKAAAAVLMQYYRVAVEAPKPTVFPVSEGVRSYNYNVKDYDASERTKMDAFMHPLVHAAFVPVPNKQGEEACVKGRITGMKRPEPKSNQFVDQCMIEFAERVVRNETLFPVDVESVVEKQTRSAQKMSLSKAMVAGPYLKRVLKCFIKAESYADVKDPRNISTYNDADKLTMAQFALALSEHLKRFPWYGPGKNPLQIAERVSEICQSASFVNQSDMKRMDGTITNRLRVVDRMVFMKAFAYHRACLNELLNRNKDNIGILPNGTKFEQGSSHGSGCSATSVSQTLRNAFTSYIAYRHTRSPSGEHYSPDEAFGKLGIYLGDDGLQSDLPLASHEWAASKVGLILEAEVVQYGNPGVTFLARYYSPEVWNGCLDSMCDVKRQLSKFHVTLRLPANVKPEEKLVEKARGYLATDGNTPVIGRLCKAAVTMGTLRAKRLGVAPWWSKFEQSVQFPNENVDYWMDSEFHRLFPEFDRETFDNWMDGVGTITDLLQPPLCCEIKPATPTTASVVVDGDVLPARTSSCPVSTKCVVETKQENPSPKREASVESDGRPWHTVKRRTRSRGRSARQTRR